MTNGLVAKRCVSCAVVFGMVYSVWLGYFSCGQVLAYFSAIELPKFALNSSSAINAIVVDCYIDVILGTMIICG